MSIFDNLHLSIFFCSPKLLLIGAIFHSKCREMSSLTPQLNQICRLGIHVISIKKWKGFLTLSWQRSLSHRNQSIDLLCKSMEWFLYDNGFRHERVKANLASSPIFNCCTDAETTDKNSNVSHNHHLLDYGVCSFCMGTNANLSLLFGKIMRAIFQIHFFLHLLLFMITYSDFFQWSPYCFNVFLRSWDNASLWSFFIHV